MFTVNQSLLILAGQAEPNLAIQKQFLVEPDGYRGQKRLKAERGRGDKGF